MKTACLFVVSAVLLLVSGVSAAQTTVPHQFNNGEVADANDVNENFEALAEAIDNIPAGPKGDPGPPGPQGEPGIGDLGCTTDQYIKWNDAGGVWECTDLPLSEIQADTCALYVLTGNNASAPDYCAEACPCFSQQGLADSGVQWTHCNIDNFADVQTHILCDDAAWDGDDNCNLSPQYAAVNVVFGNASCGSSVGDTSEDPISGAAAQACQQIIEAVVAQESLCCDWNNNVPLCP